MSTTDNDLDSPFQRAKDVIAGQRLRGLPKNFCPVPFTTLLLEPDGIVNGCRQKGSEFKVGDVRDQTLQEIWNGDFMRRWRMDFLEGRAEICSQEIRDKACHLCPDNNQWLPDIELDAVQNGPPRRLGLNLNGKCNLRCQMCDVWEKPNGFYDRIGFWEKIEEAIAWVKEVELLSGEPFIQKDTYRLMDLVSEKNPDCLWSITTNAHWKFTDGIEKSLDKIRFKRLIVSIDSLVPDTYSKIRRQGNLSVVMETLDRLIDYDRRRVERGSGSLRIKVNFLIQKDNWKELGSFTQFEETKKVETFRTFLYRPTQYSLLTLGEKNREEILDYYLNHLSPRQFCHSMRVIVPLLDSLSPIVKGDFLLRARDLMQDRLAR